MFRKTVKMEEFEDRGVQKISTVVANGDSAKGYIIPKKHLPVTRR